MTNEVTEKGTTAVNITEFNKIYFACTGNTCRSPMAQRIFQEHLAARGIKSVKVESRRADIIGYGQGASNPAHNPTGQRMSEGTEAVILHMYGDSSFVKQHMSRSFTPYELKEADLVIVMSPEHRERLMGSPNTVRDDKTIKVYTLGELIGHPEISVADPIGRDTVALSAYSTMQGLGTITGGNLSTFVESAIIEARERAAASAEAGQEIEAVSYAPNSVPREIEMQLRATAYMPTFNQLDSMIGALFEQESLTPVSLYDWFMQGVFARHSALQNEGFFRRVLAKAGKTLGEIIFKDPSPEGLCDGGSYISAAEHLGRQRLDAITAFDNISRLGSSVDTLSPGGMNGVVAELDAALKSTIVPELLIGTRYLGKGWAVNYDALNADIGALIVKMALAVPPVIRDGTKDAAIAAKKLGDGLLDYAEEHFAKKPLKGIYSSIVETEKYGGI